MYFFVDLSPLIVDNSVGERSAANILHAKLRIPLTIKLINRKAPLFPMFERVEYGFQVAAVGTVRCEVFDELEA
jgi:hypothetical protein